VRRCAGAQVRVLGRQAVREYRPVIDDILRIGSGRLFQQLHVASDVLAGFAWGLAWLAVCVLSVDLSRRYRLR